MTDYHLVFDGGSKGNPGIGYGSYAIVDAVSGNLISRETLEFGDDVTNNQAEYRALIEGIKRLIAIAENGRESAKVTVFGDSQLVINQINGLWKIKNPELFMLRNRAVELLNQFGKFEVKWHSRVNSVSLLGH